VDTEDLHSSDFIGHANVDFSIETTGSSEGWVKSIWSVSGSNDDNLASSLGSVHQGEELGDNTLFGFTLSLLSVWSN